MYPVKKTEIVKAGKGFRIKLNGIFHRNAAGDFAHFKKEDDAKNWLIEHLANQLWLTKNQLENIQEIHTKFTEAKRILFGDMITRIDDIENRIDRFGRQ
jgi:hypothetical protein